MIELIKKSLMASIGATAVTKEAIESALNELVAKGKLSTAEAKATVDKIVAEGKNEFENVREDLNTTLNDLIMKANLVTQKQYETLERRVAALEQLGTEPSDS